MIIITFNINITNIIVIAIIIIVIVIIMIIAIVIIIIVVVIIIIIRTIGYYAGLESLISVASMLLMPYLVKVMFGNAMKSIYWLQLGLIAQSIFFFLFASGINHNFYHNLMLYLFYHII